MTNKTKAELEAENEKLQTRIVLLERAKKKSTAQAQEIKSLRAERLEAEQRRAATAEILKVIAASPSDVQPVFDAIAESAMRLFGGQSSAVTRVIGDMVHLAAITSTGEEGNEILRALFPVPVAHVHSQHARVARTGKPTFRADFENDPGIAPAGREMARARGFRSDLVVPMLLNGVPVGVLSVARSEPGEFTKEQIGLLETFAAQAVIAIENVRLFNETKEALERQTATAEILKVISGSPTETQPVFEAIVRNAGRVCDAGDAVLVLRDGDQGHAVAHQGPIGSSVGRHFPLTRGTIMGRTILDSVPIHVDDIPAAADFPEGQELAAKYGFHTGLSVPLVQGGRASGAIVLRRAEIRPFTDKQVAMVQSFADQAVIAIENVRLFKETQESLERQTATAEILKVIAGSPNDVQPVFDAIANSSNRLIGGFSTAVTRVVDDALHLVAYTTTGEAGDAALRGVFPIPISGSGDIASAIQERRTVQVSDIETDAGSTPRIREMARARGWRSRLLVPLIREGIAVGLISTTRREPGEFGSHQVELLETFADQAVIAIENVRLFNETKEALEQQTATAGILSVISSSPTDVQPVFDAIVESAARLFYPHSAAIVMREGDLLQMRGAAGPDITISGLEAVKALYPIPFDPETTISARVMSEARPLEMPDTEAEGVYPIAAKVGRAGGFRSSIYVPLVREGKGIGVIALTHPEPATKLTDKQLALLQTFAAQAVIAIENVRLFNETKESLERQTATAEILKVISSSPTDVQPVFDAIVKSGARLFHPCNATITMLEGGEMRWYATAGADSTPEYLERLKAVYPLPFDPDRSPSSRAIAERRIIKIMDAAAPDAPEFTRRAGNAFGFRTGIFVPLIRENEGIGTIILTHPQPGFPLSESQLALVQTFADQAVIAIENVRLFNETKEALERQTATAEILRVISRTQSDLQPVFDAIAANATRLCGAVNGIVYRYDGSLVHLAAHHNLTPDRIDALTRLYPHPPTRGNLSGRALLTRSVVHVPDVNQDPEYLQPTVTTYGFRTGLAVPMLHEGVPIGAILIARDEVAKFSDEHIAMLQTFADQAVIAIENVRLFNETKEALERQTATAEILKVISSSPTDDQPVFDAIVESAARLFVGRRADVRIVEGGNLVLRARSGGNLSNGLTGRFRVLPVDRDSAAGQCVLDCRMLEVADTRAADAPAFAQRNADNLDYRSNTFAPLVNEGKGIGVISVTAEEPGRMSDKEKQLLQTFADQAVIAIQNVRLFKELESRTAALSQSVGQLTALGEVGQAISSTLDLDTVLKTIVSRAVQLTGLDGGAIYEYDEHRQEFRLQISENMAEELVQVARNEPVRLGNGAVGRTGVTREPTQVPDTLDDSYKSDRKELMISSGYRAVLAVPLLREDNLLGALLVTRKSPGPFAEEVVALLQTFATQSAMAIQNARLFREIAEKGRQLETASRHKSDFLASMSHELRTPLNAILGFNELILAEIYGAVPEDMKVPLADIQSSGKHLLRLINNVLDLAKIEAGRMELALADYSVHDTVESVRSTLRPLAAEKGLEFHAIVPEEIPLAYGDYGRITQCLMNLAGNSLKFTKTGKVEIVVALNDAVLTYRVNDTGIGIAPDKIANLFTEFKQTDATIASEYGGTGLGLSISKKFIEMHGGRVWVESELGRGSSFIFEVPLRVEVIMGADS